MIKLSEITSWEQAINQVVCGDSLSLMKMIPSGAIDLVLTDPPYGIGANDKNAQSSIRDSNKYFKGDWDNFIPTKEYFDEMMRVSKNQIIWGGNYFVDKLRNSQCWLVWNKVVRGFSLADGELAWTSFDKAVRIFDMSRGAVRDWKKHPTQKPLELMRWCLENYAKEGDLIFDGFAGSFTTARACKDMGFDWIAIDKEEKYCQIGEKRLEQEVLF